MPNPDVKTTNKLRASEKNMSHTALIKITLNYWKRWWLAATPISSVLYLLFPHQQVD
jgi:hypothetical protein